jgi:hypothetical protein
MGGQAGIYVSMQRDGSSSIGRQVAYQRDGRSNQGIRWLSREMRSNREMDHKTGRCVAVGMGNGWQDKMSSEIGGSVRMVGKARR